MSKGAETSISFSALFLAEVQEIARLLDTAAVERMASLLASFRERSGHLFILGVGGAQGMLHTLSNWRELKPTRQRFSS